MMLIRQLADAMDAIWTAGSCTVAPVVVPMVYMHELRIDVRVGRLRSTRGAVGRVSLPLLAGHWSASLDALDAM